METLRSASLGRKLIAKKDQEGTQAEVATQPVGNDRKVIQKVPAIRREKFNSEYKNGNRDHQPTQYSQQ